MGEQLLDSFRGRLQVELETEDAVVQEKGLVGAGLAFEEVDSARRQVKGIAVPVEHGRYRRQTLGQGSALAGGGQAHRKPADFPVTAGVNP